MGFQFSLCFPSYYDVHVDNTNSTYTNIYWQGGNANANITYFKARDQVPQYEYHYAYNCHDSLYSLAPGTEYTYYIGSANGSCATPEHHFRTPRVEDCNSCDHYRECINYTSFSGTDRVTCYKGTDRWADSVVCVVDNGPESPTSQHTKHADPNATDPRTGNLLHPVPAGDSTSVRLGNWLTGEGESILYELHVDTNDFNLMLLKYASVFQMRSTFIDSQKPRFSIRLLDQNCLPVDARCYSRDILPQANDDSWNYVPPVGQANPYFWRDWRSMAIDLSPYHGKTLYLQLSTLDGQGAAYAYFTLHCSRKQIDRQTTCGNSIANTFFAPEGFNYRWYSAADSLTTLSTDISLSVAQQGLYRCRVSPTDCDDPHCGYIINALAVPRFPHADFDYVAKSANCKFDVKFVNRSYIADANGTPLWTNEDCETAYWDFGNGQTSTAYNAEVSYSEPGTYNVKLVVGIADDGCTDTLIIPITLEYEHPVPYISGDSVLCQGFGTSLEIHNAASSPTWTFAGSNHNAETLPVPARFLTHSDTAYCEVTDSNECTYNMAYPIRVNPVYNQHVYDTICTAELPWQWRDEEFGLYTSSGLYVFNRRTVEDCDSTVNLHLKVSNSYEVNALRRYCDYEPSYTYADSVYTAPGHYTYTYHLPTGCDSIVHIDLQHYLVSRDTIEDDVCRGDAYNAYGFSVPASQTGTVGHLTRTIRPRAVSIPCDSIVTLELDIRPQTASTVSRVVNQNDLPYLFNGISFNHSVSDTVIHISNQYGCDSAITFSLTIQFNVETRLYRTICADALPYTWDGITFAAAGTETKTFRRANGTDSVVYRTLTVNPVYHHTTQQTICDGASLTFCGTAYSAAGTYSHPLTTAAGCDSTETLVLAVNPVNSVSLDQTVCSNHPYTFAGVSRTTLGTYTHTFLNRYQCDSTVTLHLTVNPVSESTYYDTCVENDLPRLFNGVQFTTDVQNRPVVVSNHLQCDSTIHYYLTIHRNRQTTVERTLCADALPYSWDGSLFQPSELANRPLPATLTHTDVLQTQHGADSTVTRILHVNPTYNHSISRVICNNQSYSFAGTDYTVQGSYTAHLRSVAGCDSTVTLGLTVHEVTYGTVDEVVMENDLPHTYLYHTYTAAQLSALDGALLDTLTITNAQGCDSVVAHSLLVHWNAHTAVDSAVCFSSLPFDWDGTLFSPNDVPAGSGTVVRVATLRTVTGSDSVVTRTLTVHPVYDNHLHETICDDATRLFDGVERNTTGQWTESLLTPYRCDSIVTLHLTVHPVTYSTVGETIVENQLPYHFNGVGYTSALLPATLRPVTFTHLDTVTITNTLGCDSVIYHTLNIHLNVFHSADSTICDSELPLAWNHRTFTAAGTLLDTLRAATGADSVLTMTLHVNPTYQVDYQETICSNQQSGLFNGATYNTPGDHPATLQSMHGCDSLEVLHLTVLGTSAAVVRDTVVENLLPRTFNGAVLGKSLFGDEQLVATAFSRLDSTITITNQLGCDSVIAYSLYVHWNVAAEADSTICENLLPFGWNHRTFASAGVLTDTLVAHTGADSVLTMTLHVDTNSHSLLPDTIVENDLPYTFNGVTYTRQSFLSAAGEQLENLRDTIVIVNHKGCDSIIYHPLHIHWNKKTHLYLTLCENELPYTWQGGVVFSAQSHPSLAIADVDVPAAVGATDSVVYPAAHQEDSTVVLHLTVNPNTRSTLADTTVENQLPFAWNGVSFTMQDAVGTTASYADLAKGTTLANAAGCDSAATMLLHVWRNVEAEADSSVCENYFPFTWNQATFTATGIRQVMLQTTHGADSLLTMQVTRLLNTSSSWRDTIVENQLPYTFNGYVFPAGLFPDTASYDEQQRLRPHFSYLDSTVIIANADGCDSIIGYRLHVHWNVHTGSDSTVCADVLPLAWNARTFTAEVVEASPLEGRWHLATLLDTLDAHTGADSIVSMRLHVKPVYVEDLHDTVCEEVPYDFYEFVIVETGIYDKVFTTVDGCDSIKRLHFANYPKYDLVYRDTICDYSGTMRQGVEYYGSANMLSSHGCDSNEVYHLWGNPVSYVSINDTIGDNQLPYTFNGQQYNGNAQVQLTLTNLYQCDSIIRFSLCVLPVDRLTVERTVCDSELPYTWDGSTFTAAELPAAPRPSPALLVHIDTLRNRYGIDSIVTRHLNVYATYDITLLDTTCNGAPYHFGNSVYTTTGTYTQTYTTAVAHCDSVMTLQLTVNAMSYATIHQTIVENDLPYTFGGVTFTSVNGVTDTVITILNTVACDSVITYSLTVHPNAHRELDTTVCDNHLPLLWHGLVFDAPGLLFDTLATHFGADSVLALRLATWPTYSHSLPATICSNQSYTFEQADYSAPGDYPYTYQSINHCDSVVTLRLTVHPAYYQPAVDTFCAGQTYQWRGHTLADDSLYATLEFFLTDSLLTAHGCDSVLALHLTKMARPQVGIAREVDCEQWRYTLSVEADRPYYTQWSSFPHDPDLDGHEGESVVSVAPDSALLYYLYVDYREDPFCPVTEAVAIQPLERMLIEVRCIPDVLRNDNLFFSAYDTRHQNHDNRTWYIDGQRQSQTGSTLQSVADYNADSVVVTLEVFDGNCYLTTDAVIHILKVDIVAPNVFTPLADNNNRFFLGTKGVTGGELYIYNRQGMLVHRSSDYTLGWDGRDLDGQLCPQAAYVWKFVYRAVDYPETPRTETGTVLLVK